MAGGAAGPAKATADTALGRGVLHQKAAASQFTLTRREPSAAMAPFVDFYWILRWDLRGRPPHDQTILPRDFTATIGVPPARYVTHPTTTLQIPRV